MFETSGKLDEAFYKETWWLMFGRGNKYSVAAMALLVLVSVALGLYWQDNIFYVYAIVGVLLTAAMGAWLVLRQRKVNLSRMKEINGVPEAAITTRFLEEGVQHLSHDSNGTVTLPYDSIKKLSETAHYLLLITKTEHIAVVFKGPELDREGLLAFLKTKPTAIKWRD